MTENSDYELKPQPPKPANKSVPPSADDPDVITPPTSSTEANVEAAQALKQAAAEQEEDIRKNKGMALLSYLGVLVVVPMVFGLHSRFVRHHANQGLILFSLEVIVWAGCKILMLLGYPVVHLSATVYLTSFIGGLIWLVFAALGLMGLLHVVSGSFASLPIIGAYEIISIQGSEE